MDNKNPLSENEIKVICQFLSQSHQSRLVGLARAGWINLKTLLGNIFRLFWNQKVLDLGVIGGKFKHFFPEN